MNADKKILEHLNKLLGNEWASIHQYFLHGHLQRDQGFNKLSDKIKSESADEMNHAHWLAERILMLNGIPNVQDMETLLIGKTVEEMLENDLQLEQNAIHYLQDSIAICQNANDFTSRALLERILVSEEAHADYLKIQLKLIDQLGETQYLQTQI